MPEADGARGTPFVIGSTSKSFTAMAVMVSMTAGVMS